MQDRSKKGMRTAQSSKNIKESQDRNQKGRWYHFYFIFKNKLKEKQDRNGKEGGTKRIK